jgi:predicted AAA+ superfamily ATPase
MFPDSSPLVKSLVDSLPNVRVVMSGSSALKLRTLNSESLAGRKQLLELYTLSLAKRLSDSRLLSLAKELSVPAILQDMLVWGGFPGVAESWQHTSYLTDVLDSLGYLWPQGSEVDIVAYKDGAVQHAWKVKLSKDKAGSSEVGDVLTVPVTVVNLTTLVTETWLGYRDVVALD